MTSEKQYRLLKLAVVVLIFLNITTISTIIYNTVRVKTIAEEVKTSSKNDLKHNKHFFSYYLNFNDYQNSELVRIIEDYDSRLKAAGKSMRDLKCEMDIQLSKDSSDTVALNKIYNGILKTHDTIGKLNFEYYQSIRTICTDKQVAKLDEFFSKSINIHQDK